MAAKLNTTDPFWWSLFSAGGTLAAFLVPIHVLVTGVGIGFGWIPRKVIGYERMLHLLTNPLVKLYLFLLISLSLFHWAHRFRYVLMDLGLREFKTPLAQLCYGAAVLGSVVTVVLLLACF